MIYFGLFKERLGELPVVIEFRNAQWLLKIQKLDKIAEKTFVFANNHWCGQALFASCV